ncbi:unnamed protein product [Merluccius merluccius]
MLKIRTRPTGCIARHSIAILLHSAASPPRGRQGNCEDEARARPERVRMDQDLMNNTSGRFLAGGDTVSSSLAGMTVNDLNHQENGLQAAHGSVKAAEEPAQATEALYGASDLESGPCDDDVQLVTSETTQIFVGVLTEKPKPGFKYFQAISKLIPL